MSNPITNLVTMDVANMVSNAIDSFTSYYKAKEVEKTERERIIACLNAITKKMETDRSNFETFLKTSFAERERLYKSMDAVIQKGLETNDLETVKFASQVMLNVYNKNPLDGFKDVSQGIQMDVLKPIRTFIED
ncbi:hypothetical protein FE782_01810 [Paenibacillus antri]|uniref:Uncharacterized protein n=1 Tax=Paenibacillus antri TaxID=2582848 RepID=A0A5R9GPC3_9BACL|nr:hypothetical protein [Paenibacillus antri]TLS54105.1 hypothetical protein FE782_01810 [Paenibacillus antri]